MILIRGTLGGAGKFMGTIPEPPSNPDPESEMAVMQEPLKDLMQDDPSKQ